MAKWERYYIYRRTLAPWEQGWYCKHHPERPAEAYLITKPRNKQLSKSQGTIGAVCLECADKYTKHGIMSMWPGYKRNQIARRHARLNITEQNTGE